MFTYFHCYHPQTWNAQVEKGLIRENAGIRFSQSILLDDELKFNSLARIGGELSKIEEEFKFPMYIDRLQGGIFFEDYRYDERIIDYYKKLLGEKFLGFQMHEWMSNLASDIAKIKSCVEGEWTEEKIISSLLKKYPFQHPFIEAQSAKEYVQTGIPKDFDEFYAQAVNLFKKRMKKCDGLLVPTDSYGLAYQLEAKLGVKNIMPEVGAQIPDTRFQIAYARGVTRTNNMHFGCYYEPWGGRPFSSCDYHREHFNEWGIKDGSYGPYKTYGENGGSSRSLQKRIHIYSYFAGAEFMCEEWGMANTFYDWEDFELTEYGKVKYDFLDLVKKYPKSEIGTPYTPIAVVLPTDLPVVSEIRNVNVDNILKYTLSPSMTKMVNEVKYGLHNIFANPTPMVSTEANIIINSDIPDNVDVVHEDAVDNFKDYQYFVNLTGNSNFENTHKCINVDEVKHTLLKLLPCEVDGGVHWFVNKTENGWLLVIINNDGVYRTVANGDEMLSIGDKKISIRVKDNKKLVPLENFDGFCNIDGEYKITIPSGNWFLARIQ